MPSLPSVILAHAKSLKEGGVVAPKQFLHLGSRAAVDQAFSRLAKSGQLLRVARGTYASTKQLNAHNKAPSTKSVAYSVAAQGKHAIATSGAGAAKALGLIREVIAQDTYLTTGRSKQLSIGQQKVQLEHAPYWMFSLGSTPAGDAVRAMAWFGEARATKVAKKLFSRLPEREWEALASVRASLPSWMACAIGRASLQSELR